MENDGRNGSVRALDMSRPPELLYQELAALLPEAREFASVPVSGFRVGAAALADSGKVYFGANQEFAGLPLNFTVHAEQAAVISARAGGEKRLTALAVSAAPCGYCRQFLTELMAPLTVILDGTARPLSDYLPRSFTLDSDGAGLLARSGTPRGNDPAGTARAAAEGSYSPYTGTKSGLLLKCRSGRIFCGSLLESAAYNPSLTALQCALTLRALGGAADDPVEEAVLAESGPAPLAPVFAALMRRVAPAARCEVIGL